MPAEATGIVSIINEVGVVTAALCFSAWLVVYLLKGFERERTQWLTKDDLADQELRLLMKESNQALTGVLKETNSTLLEMKIAITKLEESINKGTRWNSCSPCSSSVRQQLLPSWNTKLIICLFGQETVRAEWFRITRDRECRGTLLSQWLVKDAVVSSISSERTILMTSCWPLVIKKEKNSLSTMPRSVVELLRSYKWKNYLTSL